MENTFTFDKSFEHNLAASVSILAGDTDQATAILKTLDKETIQSIINRCEFLLKRDKKFLSTNQKLCLTTKIQLCNNLL